jgi:phosphoribosylformimino-5-aminoimidazole carboxamide ribotide isomerase
MKDFTVFPAIDLRGGKVVRLARGDPDQQTVYGKDPLFWAERWKTAGASWLHIINLDGVFGQDSNSTLHALSSVLALGLKVEFGGGLRSRDAIEKVIDLGVHRVFLGTAAVRDPDLVKWAGLTYGSERIAGDIAVRAGMVSISGWQEGTGQTALELGESFRNLGLEWCVFTDVARDGMGAGVDLDGAGQLHDFTGLKVVASGGVNSLEDVRSARSAGLAGVIIGRALYDRKIDLRECLREENPMTQPRESPETGAAA